MNKLSTPASSKQGLVLILWKVWRKKLFESKKKCQGDKYEMRWSNKKAIKLYSASEFQKIFDVNSDVKLFEDCDWIMIFCSLSHSLFVLKINDIVCF